MIQSLNKKISREKLYLRASDAELKLAELVLVEANEKTEQALYSLKTAEQENQEALDNANTYLSMNNLCPARMSNLHKEIEKKSTFVEQCRTEYESSVDASEKAMTEFMNKKAQSTTFQQRVTLARRKKWLVINKAEDSQAIELHTIRTRSEK